MTHSTHGNLLSVDRPQNEVETCCYPFVGEFAHVSNVMHDDLSYITADATWFAKFRASSHLYRCSYQVNIRVLSGLERVPFLGPVVVQVEANCTICFSLFPFDHNGKSFAKAFEGFGDRDLEFDC